MNDCYLNSINQSYLVNLYKDHLIGTNNMGVDGTSVETFSKNLVEETSIICRKVLNQSYDLSLFKEKLILKGRHSCPRVISIPTVRDKLVVKSLQLYLAEDLNTKTSISSAHSHVKSIKRTIEEEQHLDGFIRIDIKDFFPSIDHQILIKTLKKNISSNYAVKLIEQCISQTTVAKTDRERKKYQNKQGIPQGLSISGVLADFYLLDIDKQYKTNTTLKYYRFVDDILILCRRADIEAIRSDLIAKINLLKLVVHDEQDSSLKSSSGFINHGFDYLGYVYNKERITARTSSIDKLYRRLERVFVVYGAKGDIDKLYFKVNLCISGCFYDDKQYGWLHYFKYINDITLLFKIDKYVTKLFTRFNVPLINSRLKRFVRTYWELNKGIKSTYLPKFNTYDLNVKQVCSSANSPKYRDVEIKKLIDMVCDVRAYCHESRINQNLSLIQWPFSKAFKNKSSQSLRI